MTRSQYVKPKEETVSVRSQLLQVRPPNTCQHGPGVGVGDWGPEETGDGDMGDWGWCG